MSKNEIEIEANFDQITRKYIKIYLNSIFKPLCF